MRNVFASLVFSLLMVPSFASAQLVERLELHTELGAGGMLPDYQLDDLDYGATILGAARVGVRLIEPVALQASFEYWYFPSDDGAGEQLTFAGGVRLDPEIGEIGRVFVDVNAGLGRTADLSRFALSAGAGFQFPFLRKALWAGPFVRYGHLFATDQDFPSDAQYLVGGVAISLAVPRNEEMRRVDVDTDRDGVMDADDLCVNLAAGDVPDPERPGCPLGDSDGDGVVDREDVCPNQPQGDNPDPERAGCPAPDSDSDGVFDHADPCPTTPPGDHPDPERPGCPDADSDSDAVYDSEDQCPQEHHGLNPDPERPGCPAPDRDDDAVPDVSDACPDEPGAPHPEASRNGCPSLVRVQEGQLRIARPVFFATNRDRILGRSRPVLQAVADALEAMPQIERVSIEGHTDDVGDDAYNQELSVRRAANVRQWLVEHGIEEERLTSQGYGETCPRVEGETREARATNRRVEFRIVDPPLSPPNQCPTPSGAGTPNENASEE